MWGAGAAAPGDSRFSEMGSRREAGQCTLSLRVSVKPTSKAVEGFGGSSDVCRGER